MSTQSYPVWDIPDSTKKRLGFVRFFDCHSPLCWIGSIKPASPDALSFCEAFVAGDLTKMSAHQTIDSDVLYVIAGTSAQHKDQGLLALLQGKADLFDDDEILQLHEIPSPPISAPKHVPQEALSEVSRLTSSKSLWLHFLRALWPWG